MIVIITTRGNGYPLYSLVRGTFGVELPRIRLANYERMFGSWWLRKATYLFADIERLADFELRIAADLFRAMTEAGLHCLNDPARAMNRRQLLATLHERGVNPFKAYAADTCPRPARFPVFIRAEANHRAPSPELYHSQEELDRALAALVARGTPLRGMLVIEQAAEPYSDGLYAKWGTWRIGDEVILDHLVVDDVWLVKTGDYYKRTDAMAEDEHDAALTDRYGPALREAFDIANITFGRADHATVGGRQVIYEINTDPYLSAFSPDPKPGRPNTLAMTRKRIADAFRKIDTAETGWVRIRASEMRKPRRWWWPGFVTPRRP